MGQEGTSLASLTARAGLISVLASLGCRSVSAPIPPARESSFPEVRQSPCDDALGRAPLGPAGVESVVKRLSFKNENDREQLAAVVTLPLPRQNVHERLDPENLPKEREVKRGSLPDGRCVAWFQTELSPGAPDATSGALVVAVREGDTVRVEAATRYDADVGSLGFGRWRSYGVVTLYVAEGDRVGTGAQELGASECIWALSKDRIDDSLCYYTTHSFVPLHGAGWSTTTTTTSSFSPRGVVLHTHVEQKWSPPSEEQKGCRPMWPSKGDGNWLEPHRIAYDIEEPYELEGMTLSAIGALPKVPRRDEESLVPKWVDDQAAGLNLPPPEGGDANLDCGPDTPE